MKKLVSSIELGETNETSAATNILFTHVHICTFTLNCDCTVQSMWYSKQMCTLPESMHFYFQCTSATAVATTSAHTFSILYTDRLGVCMWQYLQQNQMELKTNSKCPIERMDASERMDSLPEHRTRDDGGKALLNQQMLQYHKPRKKGVVRRSEEMGIFRFDIYWMGHIELHDDRNQQKPSQIKKETRTRKTNRQHFDKSAPHTQTHTQSQAHSMARKQQNKQESEK